MSNWDTDELDKIVDMLLKRMKEHDATELSVMCDGTVFTIKRECK